MYKIFYNRDKSWYSHCNFKITTKCINQYVVLRRFKIENLELTSGFLSEKHSIFLYLVVAPFVDYECEGNLKDLGCYPPSLLRKTDTFV